MDDFPFTLICQICQCITPRLSTLPCGHWTCDVCLKGMNFKDKESAKRVLKCSLCKKTSEDVSMTTTVVKSHIQKKKASCAQPGCEFSGSLRDVKRHTPFCATNAIMSCAGCHEALQRASLSRHLREHCNVDASLILLPEGRNTKEAPSPFF